ncbi:hypothetical protein Vadar_012672 [Vaccinium darrowii]|uniref:Uncharacterized protein n=1 Tax=Vaccinium darrowii TaxID=229202 RepID=A0ACB7ZK01_9ERIC|nr:hypothetical protein Vadar_012672 [Vaccinium darrowii]
MEPGGGRSRSGYRLFAPYFANYFLVEEASKGSRQNGSVTSGKGLALRTGHGGPSPEPVGCRWTARAAPAARAGRRVPAGGRTGNGSSGPSPGVEQSTQNWFINNREATHAIEKSNGLWVGRRNLEVKIARYDRRNAVKNSNQRSSGIYHFAPLVNQHKSHAAGFSTTLNHVEIDPSKEFDKRITINLQPSASEWLWRSAIAELKAISSPEIIQDAFSKLHFEGVKVRSLGGLFMIITFQSRVDRNKALSNMVIKDWFKTFKHWNGEGASLSRLIWLKCRGMPLNVWCLKSFKRICEEWGEFITLDQETLLEEAFDIGRLLMVTDCKYKIDQWINITVNGRNYRVHVWEEECNDPFDVKGVKQDVNQSVQSNHGEDDVEVSQAKFHANLAEDNKL